MKRIESMILSISSNSYIRFWKKYSTNFQHEQARLIQIPKRKKRNREKIEWVRYERKINCGINQCIENKQQLHIKYINKRRRQSDFYK